VDFVRAKIDGPSRYCPDCKRLLAQVAQDSAGDALHVMDKVTIDAVPEWGDEPSLLLRGATCWRTRCRLRRSSRHPWQAFREGTTAPQKFVIYGYLWIAFVEWLFYLLGLRSLAWVGGTMWGMTLLGLPSLWLMRRPPPWLPDE